MPEAPQDLRGRLACTSSAGVYANREKGCLSSLLGGCMYQRICKDMSNIIHLNPR